MPLRVELANTDALRTWGLRGRTFLAPGTGMLFVWDRPWDRPDLRTMTMRDTDVPLDIAFVDSTWRISSIAGSVPARSSWLVRGVGQYVIEAPAGFFAYYRVMPGSLVRSVR